MQVLLVAMSKSFKAAELFEMYIYFVIILFSSESGGLSCIKLGSSNHKFDIPS